MSACRYLVHIYARIHYLYIQDVAAKAALADNCVRDVPSQQLAEQEDLAQSMRTFDGSHQKNEELRMNHLCKHLRFTATNKQQEPIYNQLLKHLPRDWHEVDGVREQRDARRSLLLIGHNTRQRIHEKIWRDWEALCKGLCMYMYQVSKTITYDSASRNIILAGLVCSYMAERV
jgi:hypothetical protein